MEHEPNALEVYYADSRVGWLNDFDGSGNYRTINIDQTFIAGDLEEDIFTDSRVFTLIKRSWNIPVDRLRVWSPEARDREIRAHAPVYATRKHVHTVDVERFEWMALKLTDLEELEWLFDYEHFILAECSEPDMDARGVDLSASGADSSAWSYFNSALPLIPAPILEPIAPKFSGSHIDVLWGSSLVRSIFNTDITS